MLGTHRKLSSALITEFWRTFLSKLSMVYLIFSFLRRKARQKEFAEKDDEISHFCTEL